MRAAALALVSFALGCGPSTPAPETLPANGPAKAPSQRAAPYVDDDPAWGVFHSKRHFTTVHLPEGRAWQVDDHRHPELVAVHPATRSKLVLALEPARDLVGRAQCEEIARKKGRIPPGDLRTLESHVTVGPEAYDTRVWVALEVRNDGELRGHLFAFGGMIRTCFFFHLETAVESMANEDVLSARLALARTKILDRITLDPPRTTTDTEMPRQSDRDKK